MSLKNSLQFGNTIIEYHLSFAPRKTIAIEVHPDLQVTIIAPEGIEAAVIKDLIHKRAGWILRQQQQFSTYTPKEIPRAYVSGESYRYLGRQYRLKVLEGQQVCVKQGRGLLYVFVSDKHDTMHIKSVLEKWYHDNAIFIFNERLKACYPRIEREGVQFPILTLRSMKTRWGSCSHSGRIILNPKLVQTPVDCIDYVILHELCHLKEHNHSKQYYRLLDQLLPDWRERRQKLNKFDFS